MALKIILKDRYTTYEQALTHLNLDYLSIRRGKFCLNFAKKCLKHEKTRDMFPLNSTLDHDIRRKQKYHVQFAHTNRLRDSAIPQLQRALKKGLPSDHTRGMVVQVVII